MYSIFKSTGVIRFYLDSKPRYYREAIFTEIYGREPRYYQKTGFLNLKWKEVSGYEANGLFKSAVLSEADMVYSFDEVRSRGLDAVLAAVKVSGVIFLSTLIVCVAPAVKTVIITNVGELMQSMKLFGIKAGIEYFAAIKQYQAPPDVPKSVMTALTTELTDGDDQEAKLINNYADDVIYSDKNIWLEPAMKRGKLADNLAGNNLGETFPVVDTLENRVLTSIKSLDPSLKSYQTSSGIISTIKRYAWQLFKFTRAQRGDTMVRLTDYDSKVLRMIFPNITITKDQLSGILTAKKFMKEEYDIDMIITIITQKPQ